MVPPKEHRRVFGSLQVDQEFFPAVQVQFFARLLTEVGSQ